MGCGSLKMLPLLQADTESAPGFRGPKVRCSLCCLKEFCAPDGTERVTGFTFAGDMMGLDGIDAGRHGDYAVALEQSGACLLPWERIEEAAGRIPLVRRQVMRMLSRGPIRCAPSPVRKI